MDYRANVVIRDIEIDGNDMRVHLKRDFAKRKEANAWLTGVRDALSVLKINKGSYSLYGPDAHQLPLQEIGRKEF